MLNARFTRTGVGACTGAGAIYFTQIFLRPPAPCATRPCPP